jgi:hypothetical protein
VIVNLKFVFIYLDRIEDDNKITSEKLVDDLNEFADSDFPVEEEQQIPLKYQCSSSSAAVFQNPGSVPTVGGHSMPVINFNFYQDSHSTR